MGRGPLAGGSPGAGLAQPKWHRPMTSSPRPHPPTRRPHRTPRCPLACHMLPCAGPLGTGSLACQRTLQTRRRSVRAEVAADPHPCPPGHSPNHACWSPCTSMARPKSASFTAAPLHLLARSRFSGCREGDEPVGVWLHPGRHGGSSLQAALWGPPRAWLTPCDLPGDRGEWAHTQGGDRTKGTLQVLAGSIPTPCPHLGAETWWGAA